MYELCSYLTNDGTVGFFSPADDDIYHSTYGALSESWQKFIIPSDLEEYLLNHDQVKILDICYGIGYNTKTALQTFIKNVFKTKKKYKKNNLSTTYNIVARYTDNIFRRKNFDKKIFLESKKHSSITNAGAIYSDNIQQGMSTSFCHAELVSASQQSRTLNESKNKFCSKILMDAVDVDKTLMNLSPFISIEAKSTFSIKQNKAQRYFTNSISDNKISKIKKLKKTKNIKLPKKFKLNKEVSIILLKKMFESNSNFFNDEILQSILKEKKYSPFVDNFMINLAKFYHNQRCNYNKNKNKSAFLHNIYYRYLSRSYKNAEKLLKNTEIELNFHSEDARSFIQSTENLYNFIFLDAFTPAKCPALWSIEFFKELYSKLEDDGMILTYSNSAAVRNAFLQNGFCVGKIYDHQLKKFIGTIAAKNPALIKHKLNELDLDLINSKAGICFRDEKLNLDNKSIILNRENEIKQSNLTSSSKILKEHKNGEIKSL